MRYAARLACISFWILFASDTNNAGCMAQARSIKNVERVHSLNVASSSATTSGPSGHHTVSPEYDTLSGTISHAHQKRATRHARRSRIRQSSTKGIRAIEEREILDHDTGEFDWDPDRMIKVITQVHNPANQIIQETCYYWPDDPAKQWCETVVEANAAALEGGVQSISKTTIWPENTATRTRESSPASETPSITNNVLAVSVLPFPTSIVWPTIIHSTPTPTLATTDIGISVAKSTTTDLSTLGSSSSHPVVNAITSDTAVSSQAVTGSGTSTDRPAKASEIVAADSVGGQVVTIPGQHLEVLPIGLAIYCSLVGLTMILIFYMLAVRIKYRREYRRRKTGVSMGLGIAFGMGMSAGGSASQSQSQQEMMREREAPYRPLSTFGHT